MKIACIGEAMVELSLEAPPSDQATVRFAGDTLNTAIYLKRSAADFAVSYVTRLGGDAFSNKMQAFIAGEGVITDDIEHSPTRHPGLYAISTDAQGERSFTYWRDNSAARELFATNQGPDFTALEKFDVLYLSAITIAILSEDVRHALLGWLPSYRDAGGKVVFDSNYRPALWTDQRQAQDVVSQMWQLTDIALPSVDDEMALFGDLDKDGVLKRLQSYGITDGALKCGPEGPVSLGEQADGATYPPATHVVDTTAAGDSFNGGYLAAYLIGKGQAAALLAGHNLARQVVGAKGAIIERG